MRRYPTLVIIIAALLALMPGAARANVTLAAVVGDGMVLQRGMPARLFGEATAGEKVNVTFRGESARATSDGRWRVDLPVGEAGGPFPLVIEGRNRIELHHIYVGDVWLCSGQSNMEFPARASTGADAIASLPVNDMLRLYRVGREGAARPMGWKAAGPASIPDFSGVGYYFGRALQEQLKIPIGLIESNVGGTAIEQWTSVETLRQLGFGDRLKLNAGGLHSVMIQPLQPFAIKGVIWYQGESNAGDAAHYRQLQAGMIDEWRREWGEGAFPFLFVQLARIGNPGDEIGDWPGLREAQRQSLSVPHTGMAVIFDVTNGNIHPPDKKPVGERLSRIARAKVYGERIEYSGPALESARREGDHVILTFSHAAGLRAEGGEPRDFVVETGAGQFRPARATLDGDHVVVQVPGDAGAVRVLYGWKAYPQSNLLNDAGLPASPFATGLLE